MNIVIARTTNGINYANTIGDFIRDQGVNVIITPAVELVSCLEKNNLDPRTTLIHARSAGPVLNEMYRDVEEKGFEVLNSSQTLKWTNNKYVSQEHATAEGIKIAETRKVSKADLALVKSMIATHGTVVAKPIYSQGQGVFCAVLDNTMSDPTLATVIATVPGDEIQIQQYIRAKRLIRVIVIDYKALKEATCYDAPTESEWKCSVCLNPNIKHFTDDAPELYELAEKTARAFKARVNYIDFFETMNGEFILNEINTACNLKFHEACTGVKIHEYIGRFLIQALKEKTARLS